jgi:hypothetical protein
MATLPCLCTSECTRTHNLEMTGIKRATSIKRVFCPALSDMLQYLRMTQDSIHVSVDMYSRGVGITESDFIKLAEDAGWRLHKRDGDTAVFVRK